MKTRLKKRLDKIPENSQDYPMLIKALPETKDILAMKSAQKRSFSRYPRKVDYYMANAALERARALKAAKSGKSETNEVPAGKKSTAKKSTEKKTRSASSDIPWEGISKAYNSGMNTKEIAEKFDLVRPKTKDGKANKYPYYLVVGYLTKLSHGVDVNGKHIEITRGAGGTRKEK